MKLRLPKGQRVEVWHPDSPGQRIIVWRPWWRRKDRQFATLGEALRAGRWHQRKLPGDRSILDERRTRGRGVITEPTLGP